MSTSGAVPTAILDAVSAAFLDDFGAVLGDPAWVHDRCQSVSDLFADRCRAAGIPATVINGVRTGETPEFPGATLILAGHFAVRVTVDTGEWVYDWTARQFDPFAEVPTTYTPAEWEARWVPLAAFGSTSIEASA